LSVLIISKEGTLYFSFSTIDNPRAFDVNDLGECFWFKFMLGDQEAQVTSIGTILSITTDLDTAKPKSVIDAVIFPIPQETNVVTITWSQKQVCIYLNGQLVNNVDPSEI
jgi:hypothetical protein